MSILKSDLIPGNNALNSYFPARVGNKDGDFNWDVAKATVVRNLYRKELSSSFTRTLRNDDEIDKESMSLRQFEIICRRDFECRLDEPELWEYLRDMYFRGFAIYDIAPESLLFKLAPLTGLSPQHRLADMFSGLMQGFHLSQPVVEVSNFLEKQLVESLRSESVLCDLSGDFRTFSKGINEAAYLPFLSQAFKQDVAFLATKPKYLLEQLENLLRLYGYLYTAQLALNIKGLDSKPTAKPLYFIMGHETASRERTNLVSNGHQRVKRLLGNIFPYLSMSESLQQVSKADNRHRQPLWKLVETLKVSDSPKLREYTKKFFDDRYEGQDVYFPYDISNEDPRYWLDALLELSVKQFDKGMGSRPEAHQKFIRCTERELCSTFVKARGQVGQVLVMNQDYITLLTNLAVGDRGKLRFHELLEEFNTRGIYFDKQSQQALIRFYERVGNVERMSDSGDAVYVRKTL